eukprot:scaffold74831_cov67-Phaeocystis_antarctica.AAC.2
MRRAAHPCWLCVFLPNCLSICKQIKGERTGSTTLNWRLRQESYQCHYSFGAWCRLACRSLSVLMTTGTAMETYEHEGGEGLGGGTTKMSVAAARGSAAAARVRGAAARVSEAAARGSAAAVRVTGTKTKSEADATKAEAEEH